MLVTDAIAAMGLKKSRLSLGAMDIEISGSRATITGTNTLAGSIATMDYCVREFAKIGVLTF